MNDKILNVAAPWNSYHYIPLNAFHPLYRCLFDQAPAYVNLNSYNNVKLFSHLKNNPALNATLEQESIIQILENHLDKSSPLYDDYIAYFDKTNHLLTALLPGEIELHHTAPFPSFTRPFVLHCESFTPIFFPFSHQGQGDIYRKKDLRNFYAKIFESPLCLGIYSHIEETLENFRLFFKSDIINNKLHFSEIGISKFSYLENQPEHKSYNDNLVFLFVNSANQNPNNFFLRGGHLVLRFWENYLKNEKNAKLIMRCNRPSNAALEERGVNYDFVEKESRKSIIWASDYLTNHELNLVLRTANFLLLPSLSLHSVSIMQAMIHGCIPVTSDTVGTSRYIDNGVTGVILKGMRKALWFEDEETGTLIDIYKNIPELEQSLVEQMSKIILGICSSPKKLQQFSLRSKHYATGNFSGNKFSNEFWQSIQKLTLPDGLLEEVRKNKKTLDPLLNKYDFSEQLLLKEEFSHIFESTTQPLLKINTGLARVYELGGAIINTTGSDNIELSDWTVVTRFRPSIQLAITWADNLDQLDGMFMAMNMANISEHSRFVRYISQYLSRYPLIYKFVKNIYNRFLPLLTTYRRYIAYLRYHYLKQDIPEDTELVLQGIEGFNFVRHFHKYFAIPQSEGAFTLKRIKSREYSSFAEGSSTEILIEKLATLIELSNLDIPVGQNNNNPILVKQGIGGYNIIYYQRHFYAILQIEGAFDLHKIHQNYYSSYFITDTLGQCMKEIKKKDNLISMLKKILK